MEFKKYRRTNVAEVHAYDINAIYSKEFMDKVSISEVDRLSGSPKPGDVIARNPNNHDDLWLIAEDYFKNNFEEIKE